MKSAPLLIGMLVLASVAVAYFLVGTDPAPTSTAAIPDAPEVAVAPLEQERNALKPQTESTTEPTRRAAVSTGVQGEDGFVSSATARNLRIKLTIPSDAPVDPDLSIVAVSADELGRDAPHELLHRLRTEQDSEVRFVRANVAANGTAELKLPSDLAEPLILLDGQYLFLRDPSEIAAEETELNLNATLGGLLSIRMISDLGTTASGELRLMGGEMNGRTGWQSREKDLNADGQLEYRAVDAELSWMLVPTIEDHHAAADMSVKTEAGVKTVLEIEFTLGATIRGSVADLEGQPLEGVEVSAGGNRRMGWMGGGNREVETEADGSFVLSGLPPGKLEVSAELDGWLDARSEEIDLADGEEYNDLELLLDRGLSIKGIVRSADKSPVEGATVSVERRTRQNWGGFGGGSRVNRQGRATSGADGRFVVSGLEEGSFTVRASLEDEAAGTTARVVLENIESGGPDITLDLLGPVLFAGRVVDDVGEPVTSFQIRVTSVEAGGAREREDFTSADGTFKFGKVGPGNWTVRVRAEGYIHSEQVELVLPSTGGELLIPVQRTATIAGTVVDTSGSPIANAEVELGNGSDDGFGGWGRGSGVQVTSEEDGSFLIEDVTPGSVTLVAKFDGLADSLPNTLEVTPSAQLEKVVLALRIGGKITGQVLDPDGYGIAGQRVTWGSNAMGFGSRGDTDADSDGRFTFENVTPGEWAVSAVPSMEEFTDRMQSGGENAFVEVMGQMITKTITVEDLETVEVFLGGEPRQPVRIHGMVTRAGEPLADASVVAVSEGSAVFEGMKSAQADSNGVYELVIDRPGPHTISATSGATGVERIVQVPRSDEMLVDLAIPLGRIEGRVTEPDGSPADGARLSLQREDGMGRIRWSGGQTATDGDGRFSFDDLEEGVYTVRANVATWGGGGDDRYGTAVVSSINVEKDQTAAGIDFKLEKAGTVNGLVVDATDSPLPGASVYFRDSAGRLISQVSSTVSDANGRFEKIGLAPGTYTVSARNDTLAAGDDATVNVRSDETAEVNVSLDTGVMVLVTLEDPDGEAIRSRIQILDNAGNDVSSLLSMQAMRESFNTGQSTIEQRVGPIPPGRYTIRATSTDGRTREKKLKLRAKTPEKKVKIKLKGDS